jgi:hypothetical protein
MSMSGLLATKGAVATFYYSAPPVYDAATDTTTPPVITSVDMDAMEIDGDPELYKALELIGTSSPTLLCKPRTAVAMPPLGTSVLWGGERYTVKNVLRLAMKGTPTAARIVVTR